MNKLNSLIALLTLFIFGCSSDDENNLFDTNQIVGIWEFNDTTFYLSDGSQFEGRLAICNDQSVIKIKADGTIETVDLYTNDCLPAPPSNYPYIGWENLGNGIIKFSRQNTSNLGIGVIRYEVSFPTNNTMKWHSSASGRFYGVDFDSSDFNLTKQ